MISSVTPAVIDDMCEKFAVSRENLFLRRYPVAEEKKDALLQEVLAGNDFCAGAEVPIFQLTMQSLTLYIVRHAARVLR